MLESIVMETGPAPTLAVIWLHGLGADGHDFEPIVPELGLDLAVRFVFPHAPVRPVTINGGMAMRAWYDILGFDRRAREDDAGIRASAAAVSELISAQVDRGMRTERVVLAGFSQGGAIALHTALREPRTLGGVLALSTYLPLADSLPQEAATANKPTPVFMAHGIYDPVVPLMMGAGSMTFLAGLGYLVEWKQYPMQHSVCAEEIEDIGEWLRKVLKA